MMKKKTNKNQKVVRIFRTVAAAAAGLLVCMTVGLNTSEAFAMEMSRMPVIGSLAKVLTIRSYHGTEGDLEIDMDVPEISKEQTALAETETAPEADKFTGDINAEIQKIVDDYMAEAKEEFEAYKEAFFATGGTEEEWGGRTMDIDVDYTVKYEKDNILSLELITAKGWVSAQEEHYFYNLDLAADKYLTLEELLGADYVEVANASIRQQIKDRILADENAIYFGFNAEGEAAPEDIEGFTTVTPDTEFYVNENGNVVIVFEKYEVAPGYMGMQEFEIVK